MNKPQVSHIIKQAKASGRKLLAVLIDPDKSSEQDLISLCQKSEASGADLIFVGGSLLTGDHLESCLETVKQACSIPVILFPGSVLQVSDKADGILFLSLISGRNPDLLIGNHVIAAPYLKNTKLEVLPTAYMLVDCGQTTTAIYMSNSQPLPYHKPEIAACTAMAGEFLGLQYFYLDGGSGAEKPISAEMIGAIHKSIDKPIIVGGGIRTPEAALEIANAGADVVVIGNLFESNPSAVSSMAEALHNI